MEAPVLPLSAADVGRSQAVPVGWLVFPGVSRHLRRQFVEWRAVLRTVSLM